MDFRITAVADEVQVFNPRFTDGFGRGDMAGKDVCQAVFGRQFEQLVQIAFTHIGIDQPIRVCPDCAITVARLAEIKDLPASGAAPVS